MIFILALWSKSLHERLLAPRLHRYPRVRRRRIVVIFGDSAMPEIRSLRSRKPLHRTIAGSDSVSRELQKEHAYIGIVQRHLRQDLSQVRVSIRDRVLLTYPVEVSSIVGPARVWIGNSMEAKAFSPPATEFEARPGRLLGSKSRSEPP